MSKNLLTSVDKGGKFLLARLTWATNSYEPGRELLRGNWRTNNCFLAHASLEAIGGPVIISWPLASVEAISGPVINSWPLALLEIIGRQIIAS